MNARYWICGGLLLGVLSCVEQPQGHCQVAQAQGEAHFAVYTPIVPMGGACEDLTEERIGFETYQLPGQDKIRIAWRTETLQWRFMVAQYMGDWDYEKSQEESLSLNVQADYSSRPDKENRCHVLDEGNPAEPQSIRRHSKAFEDDGYYPAATYHYEWRNIIVYSMPASPGQLVEGEVTYTVEEGGTECKGEYRFVALWPAHGCETDRDCAPSVEGKAGAPINPGFKGFLKCHRFKDPAYLAEGEKPGYCTVTRSPAELIQELSK